MFDGFGNDSNNQPLKKHHLQSIRERGIQIVEYDPVRFPWVNHVWTRDHRKIVVIDGEIAYTGGMNVADYYINGTEQVGEWRDMHCRIEGSAVNDLQDIFARIWQKSTGEALNAAKYYKGDLVGEHHFTGLKPDTTATRGHKMVGIINREPHTSNHIIRAFYEDAINAAQDTIKLVNPYFTLIRKLIHADTIHYDGTQTSHQARCEVGNHDIGEERHTADARLCDVQRPQADEARRRGLGVPARFSPHQDYHGRR